MLFPPQSQDPVNWFELAVPEGAGVEVAGTELGSAVGDPLGTELGDALGESLGEALGLPLGLVVGMPLAIAVGEALGTTPLYPMGFGELPPPLQPAREKAMRAATAAE